MAVPLYPSNDWVHKIKLYEVASGAIVRTPLTSGTVTGFFAKSTETDQTALEAELATAEAADETLVITCAHVSSGWWRVSCDASILTPELCDTHFAAATPYAVFVQANGIRVYAPCEYKASRVVTLES